MDFCRCRAYGAGMELLVSAGLLVAVLGWLAQVCHRLYRLRQGVHRAWLDWMEATQSRNAALDEFSEALALLRPRGDMLPRHLRRLIADYRRSLQRSGQEGWCSPGFAALLRDEAELRRCLGDSVRCVVAAQHPEPDKCREICERLEDGRSRQRNSERRFDKAAAGYNEALLEPPVHLVAQVLGFATPGGLFAELDAEHQDE